MAAMMKRMLACAANRSSRSTTIRVVSPRQAGRIMCIELLDHVITGERSYVSLKEKGFL